MTDKQYKEEMKAIKELMPKLAVQAVVGVVLIAIVYAVFNLL